MGRDSASDGLVEENFVSPLEGIYPFASSDPEEAVVLYEGPMDVVGTSSTSTGHGRIVVRVVDGLDVRWELDDEVPWDEPVGLRFQRPDGSQIDAPAEVSNSAGSGYIQHADIRSIASTRSSAPASGVSASDGTSDSDDLVYVMTHWFGMPSFHPTGALRVGNLVYAGRWEFAAHGWRLTLDQRPDHSDATKRATTTTRSTMTHVGKLERDNGTFSVTEAKEILAALQAAVSFALGTWVGVALPVGYDSSGLRAWEEWANWRCGPSTSGFHWWSTHRAEDLTQFCSAYLGHWLDPQLKDPVRFSSFHSISASSDRAAIEGKVMMAQAGIEYLAWVTHVLEGTETAKTYKPVPAEDKLHAFLTEAQIPTAIPPEFTALRALVPADKQTGPQAVTWVRNRLVHPKNPSQPYQIANALPEAWLLCREYLDLLILHRLGFSGQYVPYRPGGWATQSYDVPWK